MVPNREVVLVTLNRAFLFLHHDKNSGVPAGKKLELRMANLCLWDMAWDTIFWLNHVEFVGKQDNLAKLFWAKNSFFHGPFCPLLNISCYSRPHSGIFRSFSACSANKKSDRTFTQIRINVEKSWIKLNCMVVVEYFYISHCDIFWQWPYDVLCNPFVMLIRIVSRVFVVRQLIF